MSLIKRRDFMGKMSAGAACALGSNMLISSYGYAGREKPLQLSETRSGISPGDIRINVKPVSNYMIHEGVWTGPCRWNPNPPPEQEKANFRNYYQEWVKSIKENLSEDTKLLEPIYIEYPEALGYGENQLSRLKTDAKEVDLYLTRGNVYPQYPASLIGERYKKPVAMIGGYVNWDMSARLNSKGLEGYSVEDFEELNKLIAVLRARKIFQQTNLLIVSDSPYNNRPAPSACVNFKDLNDRFGFKATIVGYKEFSEQRDRVINSQDIINEVNRLTDKLISNAQDVRMEREWVISSVVFYVTAKRLMELYGCNAFTVECFEFCSNRKSHEWKAVPCLTHTLLKDAGYPSGCEGDINAFLAMDLLMGISKRSAYMGNLYKKDSGAMYVHHNVPGLKMMGFDKPDLPYSLQNFITEGWGAKVQMDLSGLEEKTVTIARSNPLASKLLLIKGEVTGSDGYDNVGCSLRAEVSIPETEKLIRKARNYGFHYAMVYGDYTQEMLELADMLGLEIETYNV